MNKARKILGTTLLLWLVAHATPVLAGDPAALAPGMRIRASVIERDGDRVVLKRVDGILVAMSDSTLTVQPDMTRELRVIPREALDEVQIRVRGGSRGRGALIGLGVGAVVGALVGYSSGDDPDGIVSFSAEAKAGMVAVVMAPVGAIIGAAAASGGHWETVPEARLQLGVTACGPGRPGVVLVARF